MEDIPESMEDVLDLEQLKAMQPQLIYALINEKLSDEEYEKLFSSAVDLGIDGFSLDDAVSTLNHALKILVTKTDQFPSLKVLESVQLLIERLILNPKGSLYLSTNTSWTTDLTLVIRRLLQTFKISEEYTAISFEISAAMISLFGTNWFKSGDIFPILLCSLASGRLRMVVEEPDTINVAKLVPLLTILEFILETVDDETNFFNDDDSLKMSYHIKDAAAFLFEYVIECDKQQKQIPEDIMIMFYKFLTCFLKHDGDEMLPKDQIEPAFVLLSNFAKSIDDQSEDLK